MSIFYHYATVSVTAHKQYGNKAVLMHYKQLSETSAMAQQIQFPIVWENISFSETNALQQI